MLEYFKPGADRLLLIELRIAYLKKLTVLYFDEIMHVQKCGMKEKLVVYMSASSIAHYR